MAFFTKAMVGAGIAGTLTLGAMVTFSGSDALDTAKSKLVEQANKIELFASNESKLVDKINGMKQRVNALTTERDNLQAQVDDLLANGSDDQQTIADLQGQIAQLNEQIATLENEKAGLENDLANSASNTSEAAERINALEAEIQKANTEAAELQETIDGLGDTADPMSQEEIDALGTATVSDPEPEPTPEPTPEQPAIPYDSEYKMVADSPKFLDSDVTANVNSTTKELFITNDTSRDWTYTLDNGAVMTIESGGQTTIGKMTDLNGKVLSLKDSYGKSKGKFLLTNK